MVIYRIEIGTYENGRIYAEALSHDNKRFKISATKFSSLLLNVKKMLIKHRRKVKNFPLQQEASVIIVPKDMKAAITLAQSSKN
jgi:hypothetical protein